MNDNNLMHINSNNIGLMDTVTDYQMYIIHEKFIATLSWLYESSFTGVRRTAKLSSKI